MPAISPYSRRSARGIPPFGARVGFTRSPIGRDGILPSVITRPFSPRRYLCEPAHIWHDGFRQSHRPVGLLAIFEYRNDQPRQGDA